VLIYYFDSDALYCIFLLKQTSIFVDLLVAILACAISQDWGCTGSFWD